MAKCSRCGKSVGLFAILCDDCKKAIEAEQKAAEERLKTDKAEKAQQAREQHRVQRNDLVSSRVQLLKQKIASGEKVVLYESVYLPVDSKVADEIITENFSISSLRKLGFDGWDIVAVVPRTLGVALTNVSYGASAGRTWGAGLGGNVVGVHIVVKKEISSQNNVSDEEFWEYFDRNLTDFLTKEEFEILLRLLKQTVNVN